MWSLIGRIRFIRPPAMGTARAGTRAQALAQRFPCGLEWVHGRHGAMQKHCLIAAALAAFAILHGASPAWAEGTGRTPACTSPPCLDPLLLLDAAETERYVEAFPFADYERHVVPRPPWSCPLKGWAHCLSIWWRTPHIGHLWIEPPPRDPIKGTLAKGLVWEPHVVRNLQAHVVPGSVALDVGAYIGTHALLMGRLAGPQGRVYAFEPQRKAYRELRRNIELNELANVTALRYAVGADTRIVEMNPPREIGVVEKGRGFVGKALGEGGVAVGAGGDRAELRPLDSFGFRNVSLLKIDVEGFEDEVLAGAERLIRDSRPVILLEILGGGAYPGAPTRGFHPPTTPQDLECIHATCQRIEAFGYTVYPVLDYDYIALPRPDA